MAGITQNKQIPDFHCGPQKDRNKEREKKCLIWVFLVWNSKKILPGLKSASSNLSTCKILRRNNCVNFGRKMSYLGIFGLDFENNTVIFKSSTVESV